MFVQSGYWSPGVVRTLKPHHNDGLELVYVHSGHAEWAVDGKTEWVAPGSIFYTLPWQQHGDVAERNEGLELYFVIIPLDKPYKKPSKQWRFHPELRLLFSAEEERGLCTSYTGLKQHRALANNTTVALIKELVSSLNAASSDTFKAAYVASTMSGLLIQALRSFIAPEVSIQNDGEQRVAHFLQLLAAQCHEAWSLDSMAASCDLERSQFSVYVQRLSGLTPIQLLNSVRIQRAKELLQHSTQSITNIAFDCGFESSQYFSRVFKRNVGMDARTFRAQGD